MEHPDEQPDEDYLRYLAEEYEDADYPDVDDPPNRLHFEELHELVREAAREAWNRGDYSRAVNDGWMAIRDEIRRRTGCHHLDGTELINEAIGETAPKLPLTDYVTETEKNMHRGLVNFLRGIVFYVRHPEAHESVSPVSGDREGALERLATMSICARHLVGAAAPTAIEDAVDEVKQKRFPRRRVAYDDLLRRVPVRRHHEFATSLRGAAAEAEAAGDEHRFDTVTAMYRHVIERSPNESVVAASALEIGRLIADDATLEFGVRLLTSSAAQKLEERHWWKVYELLLAEVGVRKLGDSEWPRGVSFDVIRLTPSMSAEGQREMLDAFLAALGQKDDSRSFYAFAAFGRFADSLPDDLRKEFAVAVASKVASNPTSTFVSLVDLSMKGRVTAKFKQDLDEARATVGRELPAELLGALESPQSDES